VKPTEILSDEHRVIEQVLACLETMTQKFTAEGRLDPQPARDAVAFFRNFADRCHHGKEEAHLFPAMEAKGFSPDSGPTGVMRREHELGRLRVREMAAAIDGAAAGDAAALQRFVENAQAYIGLLREHIQKEDHCLFPMANQALSDADQHDLLATFEKVEAEEMGAGTHETYVRIADALAEQYDVPRTATAALADQGCGCGH
jgi:hemerythrin-like domain-containing protein